MVYSLLKIFLMEVAAIRENCYMNILMNTESLLIIFGVAIWAAKHMLG